MADSTMARLRAQGISWDRYLMPIITGIPMLFAANEDTRFAGRLVLSLWLLFHLLRDTEAIMAALQDPSEPPMIPHRYLPFLGHVLGMFWYGASYFSRVNASTQHPIFTLNTMGAKTIVVIDPSIASVVQRASKNTSFYGMILEVTKRLLGFDEAAMKVIRWNLDGAHGAEEGLMNESHEMVDKELSPGKNLNQLSITQLDKFAEMLNALVPRGESVQISLMDFVKRTFTVANAFTVYGPQNPFERYPELVQSFWDWEAGMVPILADIVPSMTARKPWLARKAVNDALQEFVEKGHYRSASPLIQKRVQINLKHGLTTKMAGRAELILLFGIIGNAVPTAFWCLANIFGRPELLESIRQETRQAIECTRSEDGQPRENTVSVGVLKSKCPLLVSTFRETLREIGNLASVRLVTNTHTVNVPGYRPYALAKGSMIQIASGVIHTSPSVWGPDADTFNPTRFISTAATNVEQHTVSSSAQTESTATALPKGVPSAAYRAFGGGSVICPGRHFALTETLGFLTLMVHMFDVVDAETWRAIDVPVRDSGRIPLSVMKPVKEPVVNIKRRVGGEDVIWKLEL
jgi:cytochrome P450